MTNAIRRHGSVAPRGGRLRCCAGFIPLLLPLPLLAETLHVPSVDVSAPHPVPEIARLTEPVPATNLPREVFERQASERASDILPRLPGIVVSGPPGEQRGFGLRGLDTSYTRVQVDGIRLPSGSQSRAIELMNLPGILIDDIAIIRQQGADTEADGIAGRIALRLRALPPEDVTELRLAGGGRDRLFDGRHALGSAVVARRFGDSMGVMGAVNLDRRQIAKVKDFSEFTFQGGPGGAGTIIDQDELKDYRNIDGFLQFGWRWNGGELTLRPFLFNEVVDNDNVRDTYRRLTRQLATNVVARGQERMNLGGAVVRLRQDLDEGLRLEGEAAISAARFRGDNTSTTRTNTGAFDSAANERSRIDDDQYDLGLRLAWRPAFLPDHEWRTGLQFRRQDRGSDGNQFTLDRSGNGRQTAADRLRSLQADYSARETYLAGFVQDRMTVGRLTLSPGVRLEHVSLDLDGSLGTSRPGFTDLLPSVPAVLRLTDSLSARAAFGRHVSRPSLQEMAPGITVQGPRTFFGNPALEPARAWSWDAGLDYATENLFLSAGAFLRRITDVNEATEIVPNQFRYANVGDGRVQGLEFEQRIGASLLGGPAWLAPLTLRLNQTFLDSRVNDPATGPRRFSEVPRFVGNVGVEWNDPERGTAVGLNLTHTSTRLIRAYNGAGARFYKEINPTNFLDLRAEQRVAPGVSIFGIAQNLLDQKRDEFERTNDVFSRDAVIRTGRTFFLGLRMTL